MGEGVLSWVLGVGGGGGEVRGSGGGGESVTVTLCRRRVKMMCEDDAWTWGEVVVRHNSEV